MKVEHAVAEFQKLFTQHDGLLYEERYNLLNAFFATIPGNKQFNLRKQWALNSNYADLSFLFTIDSGSPMEPASGKGISRRPRIDTRHALLPQHPLRRCGSHAAARRHRQSGKSFALSITLQSAQKYDPLTFIFDLGGSYETLTRAFGGTYLNVGLKNPGFTINPFSLEPTHENMNFLYLFLRVLIEAGGRYELTPENEKALFAAIERAYKLPAEIRTLTNFASILGPLGERLHRWTQAGQFGHLFDNRSGHTHVLAIPDLQLRRMVRLPGHPGASAVLCAAACINRDRETSQHRDIQGLRHRRGVDLPEEPHYTRLDHSRRENVAEEKCRDDSRDAVGRRTGCVGHATHRQRVLPYQDLPVEPEHRPQALCRNIPPERHPA